MNQLKFYWRVFRPILLLKDYYFFIGFALLTLLAGFTIPNIDFYRFVSRIVLSNTISLRFIYILLGVTALVNIMLIRSALANAYALDKQSLLASLLIFIIFALLVFLGFWGRVNLDFITPQANVILGIPPTSQNTVLPPTILAVATTVLFTVSIFGVVYSVAYGSYSKADYAPFKLWVSQILDTIDSARDFDSSKLLQNLKNCIEALNKTMPYERKHYRKFVQESLLEPLVAIEKFVESEVQAQPQLLIELSRSSPMIEKFKPLHKAYQELQTLLKRG